MAEELESWVCDRCKQSGDYEEGVIVQVRAEDDGTLAGFQKRSLVADEGRGLARTLSPLVSVSACAALCLSLAREYSDTVGAGGGGGAFDAKTIRVNTESVYSTACSKRKRVKLRDSDVRRDDD